MKACKSTLALCINFLKSVTRPGKPVFLAGLILLCLSASIASFAGEIKSASPLTGTESLRANLYLLNNNNTTILADGVLTEYNDLYHDSVTLEDAHKFTNINENLGLTRYGRILAVERRPIISSIDTLFLKLWKTTSRNYQFEFITINLNHPGMQAVLEDTYLNTRTPLSLSGTTKINFYVNADSVSGNVNRFKIIYQNSSAVASTLPVTFTSVTGYQVTNKISIDWRVENEMNIAKYEIERSANGTDFTTSNTITVKGLNTASAGYSWIDYNPLSGYNFYRIKSVDRDGTKKLSITIKVNSAKTNTGSILIFPNPIRGNMVNMQFTNQPTGLYQVRLISNTGQLIYSGKFQINSNTITQQLFTNKNLAGGGYQLEIKAPDNSVTVKQAIVQE